MGGIIARGVNNFVRRLKWRIGGEPMWMKEIEKIGKKLNKKCRQTGGGLV